MVLYVFSLMRSARAHVDVEVSLLRLQMRLRAYREAQAGIRAYSPMCIAHMLALLPSHLENGRRFCT